MEVDDACHADTQGQGEERGSQEDENASFDVCLFNDGIHQLIDREEVVSGLVESIDKVAGEDTADRGVIQGREEEIEDKLI